MRKIALYHILPFVILGFISCSGSENSSDPPPAPKPPNPMNEPVYIGLKGIFDRNKASEHFHNKGAGSFWPFMRVVNDVVYVPTLNGIYRKNLKDLDNMSWELFTAEGIAIRDFVINGNSILISTDNNRENMLMISRDGGKTYSDCTSDYFFRHSDENYVFQFAQNPLNPYSLLATQGLYGIAHSTDFGQTWNSLQEMSAGFQDRFVTYHPSDTTHIFYGGETDSYYACVFRSEDNGGTWDNQYIRENNCVHNIILHPTDMNIALLCGEGMLAKTTDRGRTWVITDNINPYIYFQNITFNPVNHNIAYSAGMLNGEVIESIPIFITTDAGDNWEIWYEWDKQENGKYGIIDLIEYDNKLFFLTFSEGVYYMEL